MRAVGILLLLLLMGAAALQAAAPADTAPADTAPADTAPAAAAPATAAAGMLDIDARVAAAAQAAAAATTAAAQAEAPPVTAATCHINIAGNSQGGISRASMECSGGLVTIGAHPELLGAFAQNFVGVVWDNNKCSRHAAFIRFCGNTTVSINNSTITGMSYPKGTDGRVVLSFADSMQVVLRNSTISNNNATAVVARDGARLHVLGSTLAGNIGKGGPGGVTVVLNGTVVVAGSSVISGNRAVDTPGGGVAAADNGTVIVAGGSVISGNTASEAAGGGVAAVNNSTVIITGGSVISGNTASKAAGGGVAAFNNSIVIITGGSVISGNTAMNASGGGVIVTDNGVVTVVGGSVISHNTAARHFSGGGVLVTGNSVFVLSGASRVANNTSGSSGGGVAMFENSKAYIGGSSVVHSNTAGGGGGGLGVVDSATLNIRNASMKNNRAYGSGGGLAVADQGRIVVFDSVIQNNTSLQIQEDRFTRGGGGVAAVGEGKVWLYNGTKLLSNMAVGLSGGAFIVDKNASLALAAGVVVVNNTIVPDTSSSLVPYGSDGVAVEASKLDIEPGVLGHNGLLTKCNRSIVLFRRPCGVGEFDGGEAGPCLCCPSFTYSFAPNATSCQQCPANALCNADDVRPVAEYWHSSPRSLQMHMCPIAGSCQQGGVCKMGHMGNLCGQCSDGYGTTSPLRCGRCMAPRVQLGVYMLVVGATVVFITITVHFTWQDNKAGDRSLRPSDLIKVLVQFLQYTVILGSISVPWPAFLGGLFTAATVVFGVGSGQLLSLDCWLPHYLSSKLPLAMQRQLSYFVGALVVAVACVVLMNLLHVCNRVWKAYVMKGTRASRRQQAPQLHFWSRLRVTLLVTAFYAYPTLVRGALSFFACLRVDDAGKQPYPEYSIRNHTAGYWVSAIQQECFVGWHRPWALGFGLPAVLLLCIGVPLGLFAFLWCSKVRTSDAAFQEHYGFLFRNYTSRVPWWEAVWSVQTVLLTAISVFHFTIQAYYALLLMALILLFSAAAQIAARPYEQPLLHRLHLASTCCLFLVVWLSLALFSTSVAVDAVTLGRAHAAIGVIMVMLACSFVLCCLVMIVRVASPMLRNYAASAAAWLQECTGGVASRKQKAPKRSGRNTGSQQQQQEEEQEQQPAAPLTEGADGV